MLRFNAPTTPITITLPKDMIEYLRLRKFKDRISISMQVRHALENDIMDRAASRSPALVDGGEKEEE